MAHELQPGITDGSSGTIPARPSLDAGGDGVVAAVPDSKKKTGSVTPPPNPPPPFSFTPNAGPVFWKDKNSTTWGPGTLALFNVYADVASVYQIDFQMGSITAIQGLANFPALKTLTIPPNNVPVVDISGNPLLTTVGINCQLTSLGVNTVLSILVANGLSGGTATLVQSPVAPPTVGPPNGIAAKATLIARGWTVTTS